MRRSAPRFCSDPVEGVLVGSDVVLGEKFRLQVFFSCWVCVGVAS